MSPICKICLHLVKNVITAFILLRLWPCSHTSSRDQTINNQFGFSCISTKHSSFIWKTCVGKPMSLSNHHPTNIQHGPTSAHVKPKADPWFGLQKNCSPNLDTWLKLYLFFLNRFNKSVIMMKVGLRSSTIHLPHKRCLQAWNFLVSYFLIGLVTPW